MGTEGVLEAMARADLDALVLAVSRSYRAGALEALGVADPTWRARLDAAEREVGTLFEALREADALLARWRRALGELAWLWTRVAEAGGTEPEGAGADARGADPPEQAGGVVREVAAEDLRDVA